MKFTKEDAYKELVRIMTEKGEKLNLSERSINEHLDNLMPLLANDETELNAFVQQILPLMKTADANIRHDVSVGIADFKKGYKPTTEPITKNNDGEGGSGAIVLHPHRWVEIIIAFPCINPCAGALFPHLDLGRAKD